METTYTPFHQILSQWSDKDLSAYWKACGGTYTTASGPKEKIEPLRHLLRETNRKRLILFCDHREDFLIYLWAALLEKIEVLIPQTMNPGFLQTLWKSGDGVYAPKHEPQGGEGGHDPLVWEWCRRVIPFGKKSVSALSWEINPKEARISFFSSGSSQEPRMIEKTLDQLERETHVLEKLWGLGEWEGPFMSFVPPYHLYGFLFSVLWPLSRRHFLVFHSVVHWGEVAGLVRPGSVIVATPSHFNRMGDDETMGRLKDAGFLFSSASPLSYEAAQRTAKRAKKLPIEVYGSTETGGIAYRAQHVPDTLWTFFPGVFVSRMSEDLWELHSYLLEKPFLLDDLLEVEENGFRLKGRRDRIVKIEGYRTSLEDIEAKIKRHPFIETVYVVPMVLHRECLGAGVVFTQRGKSYVKTHGLTETFSQLMDDLASDFPKAVVPRRWKVLTSSLISSTGKVSQKRLQELLGHNQLGSSSQKSARVDPIILGCDKGYGSAGEEQVILMLQIPRDLLYCQGHFPDFPVVPGVVIFHWTVKLARTVLGIKGPVRGARKVKFMAIMTPGDVVTLILTSNSTSRKVAYHYKKGDQNCASGEWVTDVIKIERVMDAV